MSKSIRKCSRVGCDSETYGEYCSKTCRNAEDIAEITADIPLDRLKEICEAERKGRLNRR